MVKCQFSHPFGAQKTTRPVPQKPRASGLLKPLDLPHTAPAMAYGKYI